ncbi:MAG: 16S rRNA (cytosine(1402)-N(4))-methyltransferase RsmH [Dehalococcoidia bacterium]|nr:16S rRNA (cytosine(1402)-N(4))-methyltransferase RsmH [Dehalococcoidia bacterium]
MNHAPAAQQHITVLQQEVVHGLAVVPGGTYVDCTLGAGGHAAAVLAASSPGGRLLGIDADPRAIRAAERRLQEWRGQCVLVNDTFANLQAVCASLGFTRVNGVYFDLGLSSLQLSEPERGFSFQADAPLDMRFGPLQSRTAADAVNDLPQDELARVLWIYGEEPRSYAIARRIVAARPVRSTGVLARIIAGVYRGPRGRIHPATRSFQALRIWVNDELGALGTALRQAVPVTGPGGRICVISFHSLEDRMTKQWFRQESTDCICPPGLPVCVCGHQATLKLITRRHIAPSEEEVERNPRARSAKLRIAERI